MKKRIFAVISIAFVMLFAIVPTASAAGKIVFKEYTDEKVYYFYYPEVCTVNWNSTKPYAADQTVSATCPPGYGFNEYEVIYGSGRDSNQIDNIGKTFASDGRTNTFSVSITPHQIPVGPSVGAEFWTNFKIVPKL